MTHWNQLSILILCLLLTAYGQQAAGAAMHTVPDIESLWDSFLADDAPQLPAVRFPYAHCFDAAAQKYDLPAALLMAVARGESDFNPLAKSDRNCHGLMQIQWPATARHLGIYRLNALYEPCTNIRAGARYLRELLDHFDENLHLALAAYNYGPNRIRRAAGSGRIPQGAKWYSSYIYHHLQYIMQDAAGSDGHAEPGQREVFSRKNQLPLITFRQPYRAEAYYQHLQKRAPGLTLDWFRIGLGRYQVVMLYGDKKALEVGRKKLRNLGVIVKGM
jgi:hypothetical protein